MNGLKKKFNFLTYTIPVAFTMVQVSSVAQPRPTLCDPMNHSTPGLPVHHQFPEFTQNSCPSPIPGIHSKLMSIDSVTPSSHLILCRPLLLLPPIPPSIRVFSNESTLRMRWPDYGPGTILIDLHLLHFSFISHTNQLYTGFCACTSPSFMCLCLSC